MLWKLLIIFHYYSFVSLIKKKKRGEKKGEKDFFFVSLIRDRFRPCPGLTFIVVFGYYNLNEVAIELEHPYGNDPGRFRERPADRRSGAAGFVAGFRATFRGLVLGCIKAKFCK